MQQQEEAIKATETAMNSQGSAARENEEFLKSLEARINRLQNAWLEFTLSLGDAFLTDTLIGLVETFSITLKGLSNVIDKMGALPPLFAVTGLAMLIFSTRFRTYMMAVTMSTNISSKAILALDLKLKALARSFGASAIGARLFSGAIRGILLSTGVGAVLVGIGLAVEALIGKFSEASKGFSEFDDSTKKFTESNKLISQYEKLTKQIDSNALSTEEATIAKTKLSSVIGTLSEQFPNAVKQWTDLGEVVDVDIEKIRKVTEEYERFAKASKDARLESLKNEFKDQKEELGKLVETFDEYQKLINESSSGIGRTAEGNISKVVDEDLLGKTGQKVLEAKDALDKLESQIKSLKDSTKPTSDIIGEFDDGVDELTDSFEEQDDSLKNTISSINSLGSAYKTLQEGEELSLDTLVELISKYPALATHLATTNDLTFKKGELLKWVAERDRDRIILESQNSLTGIDSTRKELEAKAAMYARYYMGISSVPNALLTQAGMTGLSKEDQEKFKEANRQSAEIRATIIALQNLDFGKVFAPKDPKSDPKKSFNAHIVDQYSKSISTLDLLLTQSQGRQSKYNETQQEHTDEINLQTKLLKDKQSLISTEADRLREQNAQLVSQKSGLKDTSEEYSDLTKQIDENERSIVSLSSAWWTVESAIDSAKSTLDKFNEESLKTSQDNANAWRDNIEKAVDDAINLIKKHYEMQKKHALDAIDVEKDALDKNHKTFMDNKDDELKKFEDTINAQLRLINRTDDEDSFNKELSKMQEERADIQSEINERSMDDSLESRAKVTDLNKQLTDQDIKIEEFKEKRTKDLRVQNLQDNLDNKRKEIQQEKDTAEEILKIRQQELDDDKILEEKKWQNRIDNDTKFQAMRNAALRGDMTMLEGELNKFAENVNSKMFSVGQSIRENLTNAINSVSQALNNTGSVSSFNSEKREAWKQYLKNKENNENNFAKTGVWDEDLRDNNEALRLKYGFEDGSYEQLKDKDISSFGTGGGTGNFKGGKLGVLHEKELILDKMDTSNILKVVNMTRNLMRGFNSPNLTLETLGGQGSAGDTTVHMNVSIDRLNTDQSGMKQFFGEIRTEMKKKGLN